jgi:hypothetical protein
MRIDTNMAWPDDPYGTGQLWRKEPWLLAAFAVGCPAHEQHALPACYAVAYLRLHRTQAIDLTPGVSFGFRAVTTGTDAERGQMLGLFDLDALRGRRLAKIVAGWCLADALAVVQAQPRSGEAGRGVHGLADSWASRDQRNPELAQMCEIADHRPDQQADLAATAASSDLDIAAVPSIGEPPPRPQAALAAWVTARAVVSALIAGRALHRFTWQGRLDVGAALAANSGDCFTPADFARQAQPRHSPQADGSFAAAETSRH